MSFVSRYKLFAILSSSSRTTGPISTKLDTKLVYCCVQLHTISHVSVVIHGSLVLKKRIFRKVIVNLFLSKSSMCIHHEIIILALKFNFPIRNYYNEVINRFQNFRQRKWILYLKLLQSTSNVRESSFQEWFFLGNFEWPAYPLAHKYWFYVYPE